MGNGWGDRLVYALKSKLLDYRTDFGRELVAREWDDWLEQRTFSRTDVIKIVENLKPKKPKPNHWSENTYEKYLQVKVRVQN